MRPGKPLRNHARCFLVAAALCIAAAAPSQSMRYPGELGPGDTKLGRYFDTYPLQLTAGDRIVATLRSDGFYAENDDYNEQTYISRLELFAEIEGEYFLTTASYDPAVEGSYILKIYSFGVSGMLTRRPQQLALLMN